MITLQGVKKRGIDLSCGSGVNVFKRDLVNENSHSDVEKSYLVTQQLAWVGPTLETKSLSYTKNFVINRNFVGESSSFQTDRCD